MALGWLLFRLLAPTAGLGDAGGAPPSGVRVVLEPEAPVDAALLASAPGRLAKLAGCKAPACTVTASQHMAANCALSYIPKIRVIYSSNRSL